jgi:uncharacterized membrane protein
MKDTTEAKATNATRATDRNVRSAATAAFVSVEVFVSSVRTFHWPLPAGYSLAFSRSLSSLMNSPISRKCR